MALTSSSDCLRQLLNLLQDMLLSQTWKSATIPEEWKAARQSCLDLHPDYKYRLWTDADALKFIQVPLSWLAPWNWRALVWDACLPLTAPMLNDKLPRHSQEEYPWFLSTYEAYPYAIQRVDAVRYFILYHFGGLYIDLDMGCHKRLDFMLAHNFTAPLTHPVGISNDIMAARPGDQYLAAAIHNLARWNKWMVIKYVQVGACCRLEAAMRASCFCGAHGPAQLLSPHNLHLQVMFSTGPMYLTVQYSLFPNKADVAVIPPAVYGKYDSSGDPALYHLHGSSWHAGDAAIVLWLDQHMKMLLWLAGLAAAGLVGWAWVRCLPRVRILRSGYESKSIE